MGIEKISAGGAASYQGSSTASTAAMTQSIEAIEQSAVTAQATVQDFSLNPDSGSAPNGTEERTVSDKQLKKAVNDLNKQLTNSEAIFGIHEKTNRVTIKIVDKSTKEVIKEYPPEQTLDMIAKVWEIAGILVDEKR